MKIGLYCGSFDPPTLGHLDIIKRSLSLCDKLIIGIGNNPQKKHDFAPDKRYAQLSKITKSFLNVEVEIFSTLAIDFAKEKKATFLIRSLRTIVDLEMEKSMAYMNKTIGSIETIFLVSDPRYSYIHAAYIKEIIKGGKRLDNLIPKEIEKEVFDLLQSLK